MTERRPARLYPVLESLARPLNLISTNIEVVELAPPCVQTELMGSQQAADPRAMPLKDYIAETIEIIKTQPNATEIHVERVKPLRFAVSGLRDREHHYNHSGGTP
jgi:short-subunit dehydrogenase involved in D-alanine esterification of teichoic acids